MDGDGKKGPRVRSRNYHAPVRSAAASRTRHAILAAARELFVERGYAASTVSAISDRAGVAVPTLYTSVGGKPAIALAMIEFINEEADVAAMAQAWMTAERAEGVVDGCVHLTRKLDEICGDIMRALLAAGAVDAEVQAAVRAGQTAHREGMAMAASKLANMGRLAIDEADAARLLAVYTAPEVWHQLVVGPPSANHDDAERLISLSLRAALLDR